MVECYLFYNFLKDDGLVKSPNPVTPAKAGVQKLSKRLDFGFCRNDNKFILTFYESIKKIAYINCGA
jgi:hypothetical protein